MAGGKVSARQKMINLMYLVFIAMLAMNMSKEVLSSFGLMNERLTDSNIAATKRNEDFMARLNQNYNDNPDKYLPLKQKADRLKDVADEFYNYIESVKTEVLLKDVEEPTLYEAMDQTKVLDEYFFIGDRFTEEGKRFIDQINQFRTRTVEALESDYPEIARDVENKFKTDDVTREGKDIKWLKYHFEKVPLVASLTKMTQMQADSKAIMSEALSALLAGKLSQEVSMTNYTTLLEQSKSVFFTGDKFEGNIVLGRTDTSTKPQRVELTVDGRSLRSNEYSIEEGKVKLKVNAGSPGEHKIAGRLIYLESGEEKPVLVNQTFSTVTRPNQATVSADKMNVVYRGVDNPMTISFSGVSDNNLRASAGNYLTKSQGTGNYAMNVTRAPGREITINVEGTLPDGSKVSDDATFRIKDIPKPTGTIRGEDGTVKIRRAGLEISTVGAKLDDFDFDLPIEVKSFKFKVQGQPTMTIRGTKLDNKAKAALRKARRGSTVQVFDIEAQIRGNSAYKLKKVSPIIIELTD